MKSESQAQGCIHWLMFHLYGADSPAWTVSEEHRPIFYVSALRGGPWPPKDGTYFTGELTHDRN